MPYQEDLDVARADVASAENTLRAAKERLAALLANSPGIGIDVSEFQGDIDWAAAKAGGVGWAFIRSSDGDYVDPRYTAARIAAIRGQGLPFGPYHFARVANAANGQRDGKQEAAMAYYFASRMGWGKPGDFPLVYDFENASLSGVPTKDAAHVRQFVRAYTGLTGHRPIIYTNSSTWKTVLPSLSANDLLEVVECPLWVAEWGVAKPAAIMPWGTDWKFWQHSETGKVAGITGNVDLDAFYGDKTQLQALTIR